MDHEIIVQDKIGNNWRAVNARPESLKQAVSTLYAIAPFARARVTIEGWLPPTYYTYENGRVRRVK